MPDTTSEDVVSGFMGLTVVRACLNETIPKPLMMAPKTATLNAKTLREGNSNRKVGMAHEASHMSAATRRMSATGGIFNSSDRMTPARQHAKEPNGHCITQYRRPKVKRAMKQLTLLTLYSQLPRLREKRTSWLWWDYFSSAPPSWRSAFNQSSTS